MQDIRTKCLMFRAANGLTQKDMAALCHVTPPTISKLENGGKCSNISIARVALVVAKGEK